MHGGRSLPPVLRAPETQGVGVDSKARKKKASQLQGVGSAVPPARPWPPWAVCLFPPAQRRQSRPGKEPRQVRAGLSPSQVPALSRVFFLLEPEVGGDTVTLTMKRRKHEREIQRWEETETQKEGESQRDTNRGKDGNTEKQKDRDKVRERETETVRERETQRQIRETDIYR